jgi:hypothetical protein
LLIDDDIEMLFKDALEECIGEIAQSAGKDD